MRIRLSAGAALALALCPFSCSLFPGFSDPDSESLSVVLPALPGLWESAVGNGAEYRVRVTGSGSFREFTVARPDGETAVSLPAGPAGVVAVTATPLVRYGGRVYALYPAGAVCRGYSAGEEPLRLSWKEGFTARLLEDLVSRSFPVERLNVRRLLETVDKRSADPWMIDREKLLEDILGGNLNGWSVVKKKSLPVRCVLPAGLWAGENPLQPCGVSDGFLELPEMASGLYLLFRLDREPCAARLNIDGDGPSARVSVVLEGG